MDFPRGNVSHLAAIQYSLSSVSTAIIICAEIIWLDLKLIINYECLLIICV